MTAAFEPGDRVHITIDATVVDAFYDNGPVLLVEIEMDNGTTKQGRVHLASPAVKAERPQETSSAEHRELAVKLLAESQTVVRRHDDECPEADRLIAQAHVHALLAQGTS